MKVDVEELGATKRRFMVEIPAEDISAALDRAYKDLNKSVKVEGFRPGKTPRSILEKRYNKSVEAEVLERIVPEFYFGALEQAKVQPVDKPKIEETELKIKKGEPLSFTATVEIRPSFELSGYFGIKVDDEPVAVTDEDVDKAVDELRGMHATLETLLEDRPAKEGDHVVIDFEGFIGDTPIEGGKAENYPLELGSGALIPGFEEQITGRKPDPDALFDINVKFPDDYRNTKLAGKDVVFKIRLKEIKKKVLPEKDDEFAKDLGLGQTLAEMKEFIKNDIEAAKKRQRAGGQKDAIIKELVKNHEFELPSSMVEKELNSIVMHRYQEIMRSGQTPQQAGFDVEKFNKESRPAAEERVKTSLILSAIAEKESVGVTDAEVDAWVRHIAADMGKTPEEIKGFYAQKDGSLEGLKEIIGENKVLDLLLDKAEKVAKS